MDVKANVKDVFSERLVELMDEKPETVEQLSVSIYKETNISVSVGSLVDYRKGRARANIEALYAIAKHFNVATDWLLGLSEERKKVGTAIDELRLSPESVNVIKKYAPLTKHRDRAVFDYLLTHKQFEKIVLNLNFLMGCTKKAENGDFEILQKKGLHPLSYHSCEAPDKYKESISRTEEYFGEGSAVIGGQDLLALYGFLARSSFASIVEALITEVSDEIKKSKSRPRSGDSEDSKA